MIALEVNWFDEELDRYYGHNNQGRVYGVYIYDCDDYDEALEGDADIIEVHWFKEEDEALKLADKINTEHEQINAFEYSDMVCGEMVFK